MRKGGDLGPSGGAEVCIFKIEPTSKYIANVVYTEREGRSSRMSPPCVCVHARMCTGTTVMPFAKMGSRGVRGGNPRLSVGYGDVRDS